MITTPDPMDVALGRVVREMRKRKKISQTALGAALGISFQQIQKYERGTNRISFSALVKNSGALGHTASELVSRVDGSDDAESSAETAELVRIFETISSRQMREAVINLAQAAVEKP
jgi:transcriptional regulator with XRE-family HTH domain